MESRSIRRFATLLSGASAAAAGAWVLYTFPPATSRWYPQCTFHQLTGLDCPGCGVTRALHHLLHGRFGEAFHLNPLLFVVMGVALFAIPSVLRGEKPRFLQQPWFGWASVTVVSAWWVLRNLPIGLGR